MPSEPDAISSACSERNARPKRPCNRLRNTTCSAKHGSRMNHTQSISSKGRPITVSGLMP